MVVMVMVITFHVPFSSLRIPVVRMVGRRSYVLVVTQLYPCEVCVSGLVLLGFHFFGWLAGMME